MKNFEQLGKNLSKTEMKMVIGGEIELETADDIKLCQTNADCSSGYICATSATDGVRRCAKGTIG